MRKPSEQRIATVAQKTAAGFLKRRAGEARPEVLKALLAAAPDVPPNPGDEIPDNLRSKLSRTPART